MHLHAWDSPPLTAGPSGQAYLIEYPEDVMREKVAFMTGLLEDRFGEKMTEPPSGTVGLRLSLRASARGARVSRGLLGDAARELGGGSG